MTNSEQKRRVILFEAKLKELEEKYLLKQMPLIEFPQYKILPPEVQLALAVLKSHGARFITNYRDLKEKK